MKLLVEHLHPFYIQYMKTNFHEFALLRCICHFPGDFFFIHIRRDHRSFQEPLHGRNFTFWEWFYSILKLTKDWLQGQWKDRLIHGFVSKAQAQEWLMKSCNGTFLLRFSDSELGGITIAWVAEEKPGKSAGISSHSVCLQWLKLCGAVRG